HALIIAAQTALKPLLKMGVRPHLVTSLDHHEISRRFYEGLTPEDVRGVTLVCEPKVNPAVPGAFPGEVRYVGSELLDIVLGEQLARPRATLPAGATVAHLSYQLARFMGCDPVVLVGQDLAFTDGLYYGPGAAIHEVWAGELGAFRSLELLEWERIARSKRTLRVTRDQRGEPVFTDEQMASYLASFEELFSHDRKLGRRVIDASEGGAAKQHAEVMTLRDALALAVRRGEDAPDADLESASASAGTTASGRTPAAVGERLDTIAQQAQSIASGSREAASLLSRMAAVHRDHARVNELIAQVYAVRDRVTALTPGYRVVDFLNQTGAMRRIKADRAIELDAGADELERQRLQIERDRQNVEWTAEAADRVGELMHAAARVARDEAERQTRAETDAPDGAGAANAGEIDAIIIVDPETGGLWSPRTLEGVLVRTVERVLRSSVRACVLVCEQPERVRSMLGAVARDGRVVVERANLRATSARRASIGAARRHAASSWRGGPGSLTIYDEAFDPSIAERVMTERSAAAAIVLGADWAMIDPALIDACCDRWRETGSRMVFTQATPGLAPCVIDLKTTQTLGEASRGNSHFASIGAVLGYLPTTPQSDPIASTMCVRVDPAVRDLGVRCVEDAAPGLLDEIDASDDAPTIARKLRGRAAAGLPRELMLEVCTGRLGGGAWGRWLRGGDEPVERTPLTMALAHRVLRAFALGRPDGALTLHGVGDPMMHPKALDIVRMGEELGLHGLHLRTELTGTDVDEAMLLESGAGVISIDLLATTAKTREAISGHDRFEVADARAERLAARAREDACGGMPGLWVVPRITRCAQASGEIPDFVDRWIMTCGSAAIDPGPAVDDTGSDRFRPLPIPASAGQRLERDRLVVLCDGRVRGAGGAIIEGVDLNTCTLDEAWRAVSVTHQRAAAELEAKRRAAGAHARTGTRAEAAA
ncbi:MAG: 6-hydroxymethylpterin diphosphokinase MptE-like protein, partial [Planctomycetota bacterium]